MFSNKANRPKVTNFKVYALILMLMPVAFLIKTQPVQAAPATFAETCTNAQVKLINASQRQDGVVLSADCDAYNPPGSGLPGVVTRPTQLDLNGIDLSDNDLTVPNDPVDKPSTFQNQCNRNTFTLSGNILLARCYVTVLGRFVTLSVTLQGISNVDGKLVYDYAEDGF
jgi:hypothetical protein